MEDNFNYTEEPLKGLNREEGQLRDLQSKGYNLSYIRPEGISFKEELSRQNIETPTTESIGFVGVNDSIYDEDITTTTQLNNIQNARGELQPWYSKIGAGVAKGTVLAGTTFLNTMVGLPLGIIESSTTGRLSALWDNEATRTLQAINDWAEQEIPNYYTDAELNGPWTDNILTANFLGDKLIKNLGFTVGAFYGGSVVSSALKAIKLPQVIGAITNSSKAPSIVTSGIGATVSAIGEGSIEALNNSRDMYEPAKQELDLEHEQVLSEIEQSYSDDSETLNRLINIENARYNETLGKLTEDRLKMGNADLLMNLPILLASNLFQFGRLYARGFKTARKATKVLGTPGRYVTPTASTFGKYVTPVAKALGSAASEGTEELSQEAANRISRDYYEADVANFYRSKINPKAEIETLSWMKSFANGINKTVNDGSSWEQFFIGSLTGALGIPRFRNPRSSEGSFRSPIILGEGAVGKYREYKERSDREQRIVDYMNDRVNSPEFVNYYQGLIRHNKYQDDMNRAVDEDNEFDYKNAEHGQLISDISMFDNAGRLKDLTDLVSSAYDTSDANLQAIVEGTTSTTTDVSGKEVKVGPFIDKNGNPMYSTEEGKQSMINKLTQSRDEILNTINEYNKIKNDIDISVGQVLSDDQLEELTWLKSQINNWESRANQLASEVKPVFNSISENLSQLSNMYHSIKSIEGKTHKGLSDLYNKAFESENALERNRELLSILAGLNDVTASRIIAENPRFAEGLKTIINDPLNGITADEAIDFSRKIDDIGKLIKATHKFEEKFKEYTSDPNELNEDIEAVRRQIAKEEEDTRIEELKSRVGTSTSLIEFRGAINEIDDPLLKEKVVDNLEKSGSSIAKDYKDVESYRAKLVRAISSSEDDMIAKGNAIRSLESGINRADNVRQLYDPTFYEDPSVLYDEDLSPEENNLRYQEAQYALLKAINQVAEDTRFSQEFSEPEEITDNIENVTNTPSRDFTGASETSTIPVVNINNKPIDIDTTPIGNTTSEEVFTENAESAESDNDLKTTQSKRPYYRPSIPELDIEASKRGDFRPFNVVVNERDSRLNFDNLYNYLRDNGAFDYVNSGNLSKGDDLGFMMDPEFNDTTIFIIDTRNNQIVGSLDESQYSIDRYEGLAELESKIRSEYSKRPDKSGRFIATPTVRVSKIMIGRIPYSDTERDLVDIPNINPKESIFGIIKNGRLDTNGKLADSQIIKPLNIEGKEGRMYLLIPNANRTYSPAAVRIKHFNRNEFNPDDVVVKSSQVYKNILSSINELASSTNSSEVAEAMSSLKRDLYIGDVSVMWYDSGKSGGIRINKKVRDSSGNIVMEKYQGRLVDKEEAHFVTFTEEWDPNTVYEIGENNEIKTAPDYRDSSDIAKEITSVLLDLNLPIQVNIGMLNKEGYNNLLLNSRVVTSNIIDARVLSSWFTTDYFDVEGNLHASTPPAYVATTKERSIENPIGGTEGVINGHKVVIGGKRYGVDLTKRIIYDENNNQISPDNSELIFDVAWADFNFGGSSNGSLMVDNKVIVPSGKVLDIEKQTYLKSKEADIVKKTISSRSKSSPNVTKVIDQIAENQKKVDKIRTSGEYYYILEDDGQYHEYERVHKRLGNNWMLSNKQSDLLEDIGLKLSIYSDNISQYNDYLKNLSNYYKVDLSQFGGSTNINSRNAIVSIIRDNMVNFSQTSALSVGSVVDSVIRNFFTSNDTIVRPSEMTEKAFTDLINSLTEVRSNIEARGERFLTNNIVLFQKYEDGSRIAGEVDILSVDSNGNFRIYDVKTSKYSFYDFIDRNGKKVNYFNNKSDKQSVSTKDYYTNQLSAYKNLFESQYHTPIVTLAILPFVVNHRNGNISDIRREKGIMLKYNPSVNVPLVGTVASEKAVAPIFNSALEIQDPINNITSENRLKEGEVGYFLKDGKLHKGYLSSIGEIEGAEVYLTKNPTVDQAKDIPYIAVLPNGNTIVNELSKSDTEEQAKSNTKAALEKNHEEIITASNQETVVSDSLVIKDSNEVETNIPATILSAPSSGIERTLQAEMAIQENDDEFNDDLLLRSVDPANKTIWNREKELEWINRVIPQLSERDKVRVIKGLVKVARTGEVAWGQFSSGMIILSDIAAEGTTYHEAYHAVFNLLLNEGEREELYKEAREIYGDKSELELEEDMAESFREYVMSRENRGIKDRILNFFRELYEKIRNWKQVSPSLNSFYRQVNSGEYANRDIVYTAPPIYNWAKLRELSNNTTTFESLDSQTKESLLNKGWNTEKFNSISEAEKQQAIKCLEL